MTCFVPSNERARGLNQLQATVQWPWTSCSSPTIVCEGGTSLISSPGSIKANGPAFRQREIIIIIANLCWPEKWVNLRKKKANNLHRRWACLPQSPLSPGKSGGIRRRLLSASAAPGTSLSPKYDRLPSQQCDPAAEDSWCHASPGYASRRKAGNNY